MGTVKILIADDHALIRRGVRTLLGSQRNVRIVGEAATITHLIRQVSKLKPDLVIMDPALPDLDGIDAIRQLQATGPGTRVVVLTRYESEVMAHQALSAGASGYVLKLDPVDKLKKAIDVVARGGRYVSPAVSKTLKSGYFQHAGQRTDGSDQTFTNRELEVLRLLSLGNSSKE